MFFSNLQSLLNLILEFRVAHYFKSVIRTIIIEYNKSFVKKPTLKKKTGFYEKKKTFQWVKWVYTRVNTQANSGYLSSVFSHLRKYRNENGVQIISS